MSAVLLAIDPGAVSGAYAVFVDNKEPFVGDLPVVDGQIDAAELSRFVQVQGGRAMMHDDGMLTAVVERVSSMPKQGVASTFKFGMAVGIIHGVLAANGVSTRLVTPAQWKKALRIGSDKEVARALAIRLYPKVEGLHLKKHQGRAEALLLGHYTLKGGL